MANPQSDVSAVVLEPGQVASVGTPPPASNPTNGSGPDFAAGEFTLQDVKALDLAGKKFTEKAALESTLELVRQLWDATNKDGLLNNQEISGIPLVTSASPVNLTTDLRLDNKNAPKDYSNLLLLPDFIHFVAQIAHELEKQQVFVIYTPASKGRYLLEPEALLRKWLEAEDWRQASSTIFKASGIEKSKPWSVIRDVLMDELYALQKAVEEPKKIAEATAQAEKDAATGADKDGATALAAAANILTESGAAATDGGGGEGSGQTDTSQQPTQPTPVRSAANISPEEFANAVQGVGFTGHELRLILDQTAWINSGVLAQVFPSAAGNLDQLDAATKAGVNQLVRDYITEHILSQADREQLLRDLIGNPAKRSQIIRAILQERSFELGRIANIEQSRLEQATKLNSREDTIAGQVPDLAQYLIAQASLEGTVLTQEDAEGEAYNALSKLSSTELRLLEAGVITVRSRVYETAAQVTAGDALARSLQDLASGRRSANAGALITNLDRALLQLAAEGKTADEINEHFNVMPGDDLLKLLGVDPGHPQRSVLLTKIQNLRDAAQFYAFEIAKSREFQAMLEAALTADKHDEHARRTLEQARELADYLKNHARRERYRLTPEQARAEAYRVLAKLTPEEIQRMAEVPSYQQDVFVEASKHLVVTSFSSTLAATATTGIKAENLDLKNAQLSLDTVILGLTDGGLTREQVNDYFKVLAADKLLEAIGIDAHHQLRPVYQAHIQELRDSVQFYVQSRLLAFNFASDSNALNKKSGKKAEGTDTHDTQGNAQEAAAVLARSDITPGQLNASGKTTEEAASTLKQNITNKGRSFYKYYLESWSLLTIDAQLVVHIVAGRGVPQNYLSATAPMTALPPPFEYIDLKEKTETKFFKELVEQFSKNRASFRSQAARDKLAETFRRGSFQELERLEETTNPELEAAEAFDAKYRRQWNALSPDEKKTVLLMVGLPIPANGKLDEVPLAFMAVADLTNTKGFQDQVQWVRDNPELAAMDASQLVAYYQQQDRAAAEAIAQAAQEDFETLKAVVEAMDAAGQQRLVELMQVATIEELLAEQQANASYLNSDRSLSAYMVPFLAGAGEVVPNVMAGENAVGALRASRRSRALGGAYNFIKRGQQARKAVSGIRGAGTALGALKGATSFTPAGAALTIAQNPTLRKFVLAGGTAATLLIGRGLIWLANMLTTPTGLLFAAGGGIIGGIFGGGAGAAAGSALGAMGGYYGPWNSSPGMLKIPPGPFSEPAVASAYTPTAASAANQALSAEAAKQAANQAAQAAQQAANQAATASSANPLWATFAWPSYGLGYMALLTLITFAVIWGAFISPSPTEPLVIPQEDPQVSGKYITITKIANPNHFENPSSGQTLSTTYQVTIAPKPGYKILVKSIKDEYSSFGEKVATPLVSALDPNSVQQQIVNKYEHALITDEYTFEYTQSGITGKDAFLINRVTFGFDVYDFIGTRSEEGIESFTPVEKNQTYTASATVTIGEPKVGCFELGEGGKQLGYDGGPIISIPFTTQDMNTFSQAITHPVMANPKYIELLCGDGPVTIYRAAGGGRTWWGYGGIPRSIVFYDLTSDAFSSPDYLLYNLLHESAHIIDAGGGALYRRQFATVLPATLYNCFTYPIPARCTGTTGQGEALAEATMLYVLNKLPWHQSGQYDFKGTYPQPYNWLKENFFGGVEYTN